MLHHWLWCVPVDTTTGAKKYLTPGADIAIWIGMPRPKTPSRNLRKILVGVRPDQQEWLDEMSRANEVFVSEYIRQAIDLLMAANKVTATGTAWQP